MTDPLYVVTSSGNRRRRRKLTRKQKQRLRFAVFTRDEFTCQGGCGRRAIPPEDWDGAQTLMTEPRGNCRGKMLHLDHMTPYSDGGTETVENTQTLCEPCNLAKGNRV